MKRSSLLLLAALLCPLATWAEEAQPPPPVSLEAIAPPSSTEAAAPLDPIPSPPAVSPAPAPAPGRPAPAEKKPLSEKLAPFVPKISGYLQIQYSDFQESNGDGKVTNDSFLVRRARVRVSGGVAQYVEYTIMGELATPSKLLTDAFIAVKAIPHHEVRVGQQKTQFGVENPKSDHDLWVVNRARVSESLGKGPDPRDLGLGLLGKWKLPSDLGLDYQLTLVNGSGPNVLVDDTDKKNFWGRAGGSYRSSVSDLSLNVGGSFATGNQVNPGVPSDPSDDFIFNFRRFGADVTVDQEWFALSVEWIRGMNLSPTNTTPTGFYVQAIGKTPWHVGPILRYDQLNPDVGGPNALQRRYTFGAFWDYEPAHARLMANYEMDRSEKRLDDTLFFFAQIVY